MPLVREIRLRARAIWTPVLAATLLLYFGYHAIHGERGAVTLWRLQADLKSTDDRLADLEAERAALANRVRHLRPESLDADLLDERARYLLGRVGPDDIVLYEDEAASGGENPD